tara:strand:- start:754 stop:1590 length:837 start_codon:yes stop_codon:yes gene_type:complete
MKKELLVCTFSGGRTSAFMAKFISELPKYKDNYEIVFVFCNTGKERPETLQFVKDCQDNWCLNIVWLEAKINIGRVGTSFNIVDFESASRNGEPFEEMLKKYPMPNNFASNCTRELKMRPIEKYIKTLGYNKYTTAMGIRKDEEHRRSNNAIKDNVIYPLMDDIKVDAKFIRSWWDKQTFDLILKDYEGNCDLCFKKSTRKKLTIIKENPSVSDWWLNMEQKYSSEKIPRFDLRTNHSIIDLIELTKKPFKTIQDQYELSKEQKTLFDFETDCFCKAN